MQAVGGAVQALSQLHIQLVTPLLRTAAKPSSTSLTLLGFSLPPMVATQIPIPSSPSMSACLRAYLLSGALTQTSVHS